MSKTKHPKNRVCSICREAKPLSEFHKGRGSYYCKPCKNLHSKSWRSSHLEYKRDYIRNRDYGLTKEDYDKLIIKQNGKCIICKEKENSAERYGCLHVDHDHTTGKVRGLLCFHCNTVLGHVKDNPIILNNMVKYLNDQAQTPQNAGREITAS